MRTLAGLGELVQGLLDYMVYVALFLGHIPCLCNEGLNALDLCKRLGKVLLRILDAVDALSE